MSRLLPYRWLARMWWFDLIYPSAVAILLFACLTTIVYSGRPSSRLASRAESKLLEFALSSHTATQPKLLDPDVLIISGQPTTFRKLDIAPRGPRHDLSAASYAQILEGLGAAGTRFAFVAWDLAAHPDDLNYYAPLIQVARRYRDRMQIFFAVTQSRRRDVPVAVEQDITILDDASCNDRDARETFCAHTPEDKDYVIARIVELASANAPHKERPFDWLTSLLPSNIDAFALNLPSPRSLQTVSFRDVMTGALPSAPRFAFIGVDLSGATSGTSDARFVRTVFDSANTSIDAAGTPLHVYWGQLASMFLRHRQIHFPPDWVRLPLTLAICLVIGFMMIRLGGPAASTTLAIYACVCVPLIGFTAVAGGWYIPLFDSMYFGLAMLAFVGSGRLSYLSYLKWQHQAAEKLHVQTTDLKGNFMSLVSHNLNTPIAKMQGMLSILLTQLKDQGLRERAQTAQQHVSCLELAVRFVLDTVALEDQKRQETARSLDHILRDFTASQSGVLKKLGIIPEVALKAYPEELLQIPLWLDAKRLVASMAAMTIVFYREKTAAKIKLTLALIEADEPGAYELSVEAQPSTAWTDPAPTGFLHDVAVSLIEQFTAIYHGRYRDRRHFPHNEPKVVMDLRVPERGDMA